MTIYFCLIIFLYFPANKDTYFADSSLYETKKYPHKRRDHVHKYFHDFIRSAGRMYILMSVQRNVPQFDPLTANRSHGTMACFEIWTYIWHLSNYCGGI